jgi:hypothetical protein
MKKRNWIIIFAFALALLVVWQWPRLTQRAPNSTPRETPSQSTNLLDGDSNQANANAPLQSRTAAMSNQPSPMVSDIDKPELFKKSIEAMNTPLDFYGKVIDQDSNPIPNVKVSARVRHWNARFPTEPGPAARFIAIEKLTDSVGSFRINSETGDGFGIVIDPQNGYELEPMQHSFGSIGGSFENPVIFKMWSTNIHEQLITGSKSFHIEPDGRAYFINLTDDTISESGEGDLKVWIQYTNQVVRGQLYDWSCGIEVINGGLLEDSSPAPYVAPKEGYVPKFMLEQQIKGGQSGSIGDKQFYILFKNGKEYGQMKIDLIAPYNPSMGIPGLIRLSYAINPSGSRILR